MIQPTGGAIPVHPDILRDFTAGNPKAPDALWAGVYRKGERVNLNSLHRFTPYAEE